MTLRPFGKGLAIWETTTISDRAEGPAKLRQENSQTQPWTLEVGPVGVFPG